VSLNINVQSILQVTETLEGNAPFASSKTVTHSSQNRSLNLAGDTVPPVTKFASKRLALTAGSATLDLTALNGWGTNGTNVDATGLKLQLLRIRNPAGNTTAMTLELGASNGYEAFGTAWSLDIPVNGLFHFEFMDGTPDVGPTAKSIEITGTGSEILEIEMTFG
jgi:hypothetical protein